jgi:N,N-dimethylformamidase beta subunit-like, C-terminal
VILGVALPPPPPALEQLSVSNGATPFAGDRRLLTTISPNGDGFRDAALVRFRLTRAARVRMDAVRTDTLRVGRLAERAIWSRSWTLEAGSHVLRWRPSAATAPRTYILRLTVRGISGTRARRYGAYRPGGRVDAPVVRVQGIDAGFAAPSYAPGETAEVTISTDADTLSAQVFAYGNWFRPTARDLRSGGEAMTAPVRLDWRGHRSTPAHVRLVRAGDWPSGLYFLRVTADDGRVGYAPFIVRPRVPGASARVAVVLSTNTWQAYNFYDADGDGWGDSWYVSDRVRSVDATRPFLDFGVPYRFGDWDLTVIAWLAATAKRVEFLSDLDLERMDSGDTLAQRYDLVVFPGHEEYATERAYSVARRYRDLGGNLMFLSANNFFWRVRRSGRLLTKSGLWRDLDRPEAALVGVQYAGSNHGAVQKPYVVEGATALPWAFAGMSVADGSVLGSSYGIEIDARAPSSPPGLVVLARVPDLLGPGRSAEMTYYETAAGAKVFAAGTLNFAASLDRPDISQLVENMWRRLATP